jgi:hypothetical protein
LLIALLGADAGVHADETVITFFHVGATLVNASEQPGPGEFPPADLDNKPFIDALSSVFEKFDSVLSYLDNHNPILTPRFEVWVNSTDLLAEIRMGAAIIFFEPNHETFEGPRMLVQRSVGEDSIALIASRMFAAERA